MDSLSNENTNGIQRFDQYIKRFDSFIISSHESPDADNIGSLIALKYLLTKLNKQVIAINQDQTPHKCKFIDIDDEIIELKTIGTNNIDKYISSEYLKKSGFIICDANDIKRIGKIKDIVSPFVNEYFVIDHHISQDYNAKNTYIDINSISTASLIYKLFCFYNIPLNFKIAQALYTGILVDSGSFKYERTTSTTHHIASELLKHGIKPNEIYKKSFQSYSRGRLKLLSYVLNNMIYLDNGIFAILSIPYKEFIESGIDYDEMDDFVNIPLESRDTSVSILLKENKPNSIKVSLRAREIYDVQEIAKIFGGGGHIRAAGCVIKMPFEEAKNRMIQEIEKLHIRK